MASRISGYRCTSVPIRRVLKRLGVTLPPAILNDARKRNGYPLGLAMLPQMVQTMQAQSAEPDASSTSNS